MPSNPRPYVVIDGHRLAGQKVNDWTSIVLDKLEVRHGARSQPAEQFQLPTATVRIACTAVPEYLVRSPLSRTAEIWIEDGSNKRRIFYGNIDGCSIRPTNTADEVPDGEAYYFLVTLTLISRPAALSSVLLQTTAENNRPVETMAQRLAWLNKALTTRNSPLIMRDHWSLTPIFSAPSGAGGFWPYRVAAKDYRGTSAVAAWMELALTAGEFTEYFAEENKLSAVGRSSLPGPSFLRLGWSAGYVGLTSPTSESGTVVPGSRTPMVDMAFNDAGTVRYVKPSFSVLRFGKVGTESFVLSRMVDQRNVRRAEVSSLAYIDMADLSRGKTYEQLIEPVKALANTLADLYEDAAQPYSPPVTIRWDEGWENWHESSVVWLNSNSLKVGMVHVAGSVYNRLNPDNPFHRRASLVATYAKHPTEDRRVWTTTMGLNPYRSPRPDVLLVKDINPSARQQTTGDITYGTVPDNPPLIEYASTSLAGFAAALARRATNAFSFDQLQPSMSFDDMAMATRGL